MANYQRTGPVPEPVARLQEKGPTETTVELRDDDSTIDEADSDSDSDVPQTASPCPPPDRNPQGWKYFRVPDSQTDTVYEAWEMISVQPTKELEQTTRILGREVKSTYRVAKDAYAGVRAITSYSQGDLEAKVRRAREAHPSGDGGGSRGKLSLFSSPRRRGSYSQHLASRLALLPGCLPNKLGALVDSRFIATNKNPYVRREWKIVHLEEMESVMTEEAPARPRRRSTFGFGGSNDDTSCSSRRRSRSREAAHQAEPVQKWLVILRGQQTQFSDSGFEALYTCSNPWLRVDEQMRRQKDFDQHKPAPNATAAARAARVPRLGGEPAHGI